jgi:hypothetical protein
MTIFNRSTGANSLNFWYTCMISDGNIFIIIIIGSTALGEPWPTQANVASDLYLRQPPTNFYNPSSTSSVHLDFGRSYPRWPPGFVHNIFLDNLIRVHPFEQLGPPTSVYRIFYVNSICLIVKLFCFHIVPLPPLCPLSHIRPYILGRIFLPKTLGLL